MTVSEEQILARQLLITQQQLGEAQAENNRLKAIITLHNEAANSEEKSVE